MDFQHDVIEASNDKPVLVDFWAEWCGPCQFLGPVLEELDREQDKWKLVKVNVDENQEISQQYGIRGIPDVRLFKNGEVVGQFTGAKPKHEIVKWLDEVLPDERVELLHALINELPARENELEKFVHDNPDLKIGQVALAKHVVWNNPGRSSSLIGTIKPGQPYHDESEAINQIARFHTYTFATSNVEVPLAEAQKQLQEGNLDGTIEQVIQAVMIDKGFNNDFPRKLAIAIFQLLGADHELTKKYRKRFDMALY